MAETISTQLLRSYSYSNNIRASYEKDTLRPAGVQKNRFLSVQTDNSLGDDLHIPIDPSERSTYDFLMDASRYLPYMSDDDVAGAGLSFLGDLDKKRNSELIEALDKLHSDRLKGVIKQDDYERIQKDILNRHLKRVEWMGKRLSGSTNTFNSLYHKKIKTGGVHSTAFKLHSQKVSNLSKMVKTGNILLNAYSVVKLCSDISELDDVKKKNELLWVDGTGILFGLGAGIATNLAMGFFIATGPFGWALGIVATTVAGSSFKEYGKTVGKTVYDQYGKKIDLVSPTVIGKLCS